MIPPPRFAGRGQVHNLQTRCDGLGRGLQAARDADRESERGDKEEQSVETGGLERRDTGRTDEYGRADAEQLVIHDCFIRDHRGREDDAEEQEIPQPALARERRPLVHAAGPVEGGEKCRGAVKAGGRERAREIAELREQF